VAPGAPRRDGRDRVREAIAGRYFKPADLAGHGLVADAVLGAHRLQLSMDEA
jgi:hypothetical protein